MLQRPAKIERGNGYEVIEKLRDQTFTGLLKISFRTDEISRSELVVENGVPIAMETRKIRSGRILRGNEAFRDFLNAENCVVEFYPTEVRNFPLLNLSGSRVSFDALFETERAETRAQILESEVVLQEKISEVDVKKLEIAKILDSEIGKIARKYVKLVDSAKSLEELLRVRDEVFAFLNSATAFLPNEKIERVRKEIDRILETKREPESEDIEFEKFKRDLISRFDRVLGSRELREILEKLEDWSDLVQSYPQIKKVAGKFATIVPWNKVEELLRLIEEKVAEEVGTKL